MNLHLSDLHIHQRLINHDWAQPHDVAHRRLAKRARREGLGNYAAAELVYPSALDWPVSPTPKHITARAEGMQVNAARYWQGRLSWDTAELAAVFNY